jgi:N-acetylglucosamine-6-phosphate deacetylase
MSNRYAITGCDIFDGKNFHHNSALIYSSDAVLKTVSIAEIPTDCTVTELTGGFLAPGFIDLQVNGGGGVLFNEQPDVDGIRTICATHAKFGTTGMLPTLITDRPEITSMAIKAGIEAHRQSVPGFLGLHLEGPHLSIAKKGAHDPKLIRPMDEDDLQQLLDAAKSLPRLMSTIAPESVTDEQVSQLTNAGIIVSLGHSSASFENAVSAINAGASCVTHLYNAMSPLTHPEPGMVGAALMRGEVYAGLIADGHHVKPAAIAIALAAKRGPGEIFLITDAMSTIGTDIKSFTLNGRTIRREGGRLLLEDGTLAGADLDMASAVRFMHKTVGLKKADALNMASLIPARCIGISNRHGHLGAGASADFIHFSEDLQINQIWQNGKKINSV